MLEFETGVHIRRMRTAAQAAAEFRKADPETAVKENFIRDMIRSGQLHVVQVGKKQLIDFDELLSVIDDSFELRPTGEPEAQSHRSIAPIYLSRAAQ